jgi:hypothetical protein
MYPPHPRAPQSGYPGPYPTPVAGYGQMQQVPQSVYPQGFQPPPRRRNRRPWVIGGVLAGAACVALIIALVTGSSGPKGLNDPVKLAADIAQQVSADQTDGSTVDVTCVHASGTQFTCIYIWSDDTPNMTVTATVPPDGSTWITSKAN